MRAGDFYPIDLVQRPEGPHNGPYSIYALVDPRDNCVRYVGVTGRDLETRRLEHMERPTNRRTREWMQGLILSFREPSIALLQKTGNGWNDEMEWIAWFRARADLLNVDDGGELVEDGTGWDDLKREKARCFLNTALAYASSYRPPPCAQDQRTHRQKRKDIRAKRGKKRRRKAQSRSAFYGRKPDIERTLPEICQEKSIHPSVRRNGVIVMDPTKGQNLTRR